MARPRSVQAHEQVLEAALQLFSERGIDATSMDAIADASGVSKATIYKHWPDKDALSLEVMAHAHGLDEEPPTLAGVDVRTAMVKVLSYNPKPQEEERRSRLFPHFIAYAARKPEFGMAWRSRALEPLRRAIKQLLEQGIEEGIFPSDLNTEVALALLIGPIMYGKFLSMGKKKVPKELAERVVEAFWKAHASTKSSRQGNTSKKNARG